MLHNREFAASDGRRRFFAFGRTFRLMIATLFIASFLIASGANAQPPGPGRLPPPGRDPRLAKPIPSERYYAGVDLIAAGRYSDAVRFYQNEIRNGMKIGPSLWIDSICYYAMIGESYYYAGNFDEALKNYNLALSLASQYPSWLSKVTFMIPPSANGKAPTPWGASRRDSALGVFPSKATILIGDRETEAHARLGVRAEQRAIPIDPIEILRCCALSIRRRVEILGPLAPYDPMSAQVLDTFQKRHIAPNHWANVFLDVIWGLALEESDRETQAVKTFDDSLSALMGGQACDHNLTATALLELGDIFLRANKVREAAECYYEASCSAYYYADVLLIEESLRKYSNAAKALRRGGSALPLEAAVQWSVGSRRRMALPTVSLELELIENLIYSGRVKASRKALDGVAAQMTRDMSGSFLADRWNYLNALLFYATGDVPAGDVALDKVVQGAKTRSVWARQLLRLDAYVKKGLGANGALTPRNAADLYEYLLREPTVVDWAFRPTESLAIQMIAPIGAYERQFQILLDRDLKEKAFEVSERIRRERFFATQTFGGRLVSLRYILTADDALTTPSIRAAKETLLREFPDFEESNRAAAAIQSELDSIPTAPTEPDQIKRQSALFAELAAVSARQEALMRFIAAGRVRVPYVFPPVLSVDEVQKRLPDETAVLAFIDAEGETYGFMLGKTNFDAWRVGSTERLAAAVSLFLKTLGNTEGSKQVDLTELAAARWKTQGAKLREIVLNATDVEADRFNIVFSKLVVVPDSALWYLPFEALCLPKVAATVEEVEGDEELGAPENPENAQNEQNGREEQNNGDNQNSQDAQEDDLNLDAAYLDETDDDRSALAEALKEDETTGDETTVEGEGAGAAEEATDPELSETETALEERPTRRKSRAVREREALDSYEDSLIPMIEAADFTIRYSATVSLATPNALGRNSLVETTIVAGASFPKEKPEVVAAAVDRFSRAVAKTEATTPRGLNIPGALYASRLRRLVVWEEVVGNDWNWEPIVLGRAQTFNKVSDWIACPWGAPRLIVMPALRTRAENARKGGGVGSEIFLPILAMQASGADTMLLSRWRTGGRSAYDLSQSFVERYESEPAADAWKHAANALMKRDVVLDEEPRVKKTGKRDETPKYDAPFWWAGYLLVDSGEAANVDELERLDEDAAKKAEEENALLEDDQKDGENGDATADGGKKPVFSGAQEAEEDSDASPFGLGAGQIDDEELQRQDEQGDDFFSNEEDEPSQPVDESIEPEADAPSAPASEPEIEPEPESPKTETLGKDVPKETAPGAEEGAPKEDAPSPEPPKDEEPKEKKSTGRLKLKGKGK